MTDDLRVHLKVLIEQQGVPWQNILPPCTALWI